MKGDVILVEDHHRKAAGAIVLAIIDKVKARSGKVRHQRCR